MGDHYSPNRPRQRSASLPEDTARSDSRHDTNRHDSLEVPGPSICRPIDAVRERLSQFTVGTSDTQQSTSQQTSAPPTNISLEQLHTNPVQDYSCEAISPTSYIPPITMDEDMPDAPPPSTEQVGQQSNTLSEAQQTDALWNQVTQNPSWQLPETAQQTRGMWEHYTSEPNRKRRRRSRSLGALTSEEIEAEVFEDEVVEDGDVGSEEVPSGEMAQELDADDENEGEVRGGKRPRKYKSGPL